MGGEEEVGERLLERVLSGEVVSEEWFGRIVRGVMEQVADGPNVVEVAAPVVVVGAVHGDADGLAEVFRVAGPVPETSYVFGGGVVGRGKSSVSVLTAVCLAVLRWPGRVTLLRSGHESRSAGEMYGLLDEVVAVYGSDGPFEAAVALFAHLPLAACVDGATLVVAGGLSPSLESLEQIGAVNRFTDVPPDGALTDLMWSAPSTGGAAAPAFALSPRGLGYVYSEGALDAFLARSGLARLITTSTLVHLGFREMFGGKVASVWSAPDFLGRCGNLGAVVHILPGGGLVPVFYSAPPHDPALDTVVVDVAVELAME